MGERRVTVEGPETTTYVQASYHAPQATHPDFPAMQALDSLLSGPSNLSMFGDGLSNKTSRLYRGLVEKELAVTISGGMNVTMDPYLYSFNAIVRPDREVEQVLGALDDEIKRLQDTPPSQAELQRAVKQARALHAYGSERITNNAFWLGFAEMFAQYEWYMGVLERLEGVTPEDVQRVAQTYLRPQNRVVGLYLPNGEAGDEDEVSHDD
jgi:zinc protease